MKRKLFITGATLTIIGATISTFATYFLYFYLIPFWIFVLGLSLIWFSDKKIKTKVIWTLTPIAVFASYQILEYQLNKVPPETFLIPKDYRGKIHVHFNKACGQKVKMENGRRIYIIPENGILLSQFNDKQGYIDQKYYQVDTEGNRTLLPQLDVRDYNEEWTLEKNPHEPSRDILGIFYAGTVSSEGSYEFYVSTYRQLRDSFDFQYNKKFDSLEQKIIDTCK